MTFLYEDITTLIPNTTMQKMYIDGVHKCYRIKPISNYVLHDNTLNTELYDESFVIIIGSKFGYSPSNAYITCSDNYDFSPHIVTDENENTYTAYGNRDFFTVPKSEVSEYQVI